MANIDSNRNLYLLATASQSRCTSHTENGQIASNQQLQSTRRQNNDAASVFDIDVTLVSNLHTRQGRERAAYVCTLYRNSILGLLGIKYRNDKDKVFAKLNELSRTKSDKQIKKYVKTLYKELLEEIQRHENYDYETNETADM